MAVDVEGTGGTGRFVSDGEDGVSAPEMESYGGGFGTEVLSPMILSSAYCCKSTSNVSWSSISRAFCGLGNRMAQSRSWIIAEPATLLVAE